MPRFAATVQTSMSQADAFAYMADFSNFEKWDPGVKTSVQVAGEQPGLGSVYDVTIDNGSTLRYEVTDFTGGEYARIVGTNRFFKSIDEVAVTASDSGGSLVTYDAELQLRGPLRVFDFALTSLFNRIGEKAAEGMERALSGTLVAE